MDVPLIMRKKRKICDTYTPVVSSDKYEPDGSSMSCCSSNSKSLDLDDKCGEVAEKEKKSIEEESESEKIPPLEEFDELELDEMPPLEEEIELDEMPPLEEEIELDEMPPLEEFTEIELDEMPPLEEFTELELNEMPPLEEEEVELDEMPPLEEPEPTLIPTTQELEEFFTRHEQRISTRLRENYNFNFDKEEPLEGRFEWVQI